MVVAQQGVIKSRIHHWAPPPTYVSTLGLDGAVVGHSENPLSVIPTATFNALKKLPLVDRRHKVVRWMTKGDMQRKDGNDWAFRT
jgi:hypothetical protein